MSRPPSGGFPPAERGPAPVGGPAAPIVPPAAPWPSTVNVHALRCVDGTPAVVLEAVVEHGRVQAILTPEIAEQLATILTLAAAKARSSLVLPTSADLDGHGGKP